MKRLVLIVAAIAVLAGIGYFAMRMMMTPPSDLDLARTRTTAKGLYTVSIAPEREPVQQGQMHSWVLTVTMPDGQPVDDAAIGVDGGMPQHGHGLPTAPQATATLGGGRYRIEGMRFNMTGWWELRFTVSAPAGDDEVTFNVVL